MDGVTKDHLTMDNSLTCYEVCKIISVQNDTVTRTIRQNQKEESSILARISHLEFLGWAVCLQLTSEETYSCQHNQLNSTNGYLFFSSLQELCKILHRLCDRRGNIRHLVTKQLPQATIIHSLHLQCTKDQIHDFIRLLQVRLY